MLPASAHPDFKLLSFVFECHSSEGFQSLPWAVRVWASTMLVFHGLFRQRFCTFPHLLGYRLANVAPPKTPSSPTPLPLACNARARSSPVPPCWTVHWCAPALVKRRSKMSQLPAFGSLSTEPAVYPAHTMFPLVSTLTSRAHSNRERIDRQ